MLQFFESDWMPTNWVVVIILCIMVILTLMTTIFASKAAEGYVNGRPRSDVYFGPITSGADIRFAGEMTGLGQGTNPAYVKSDKFLGGPEPPVFYDIGNINAVRADRAQVKPEGMNGAPSFLQANRWNFQTKSGFTDNQLIGMTNPINTNNQRLDPTNHINAQENYSDDQLIGR